MKPSLLFDLDGTLCECSIYYEQAMRNFAAWKSGMTKLPEDMLYKLVSGIDLAYAQLPGEFHKERFPTSFRIASYAADIMHDPSTPMRHDVASEAYRIGDAVFDAPYRLLPGTHETLQKLKDLDWQLILVTKGNWAVQQHKLYKNFLHQYFEDDCIHISLVKTPELLASIIRQHSVDVRTSYMIGDSRRDDIASAKANGLQTILLEAETPWAYNHHDCEPDTVIHGSIANLPAHLFELPAAAEKV